MLLFYLSLPFYLKTQIFCSGLFRTTPKYIMTKFRDAKIDIFDIIEKKLILCVLEMSALGTTLMNVSIYGDKFPIRWNNISLYNAYILLKNLNFPMFSVLSLSWWCWQTLGKTYGHRYQNGLLISNSFAFMKTKSCKQHALLVQRLTLVI